MRGRKERRVEEWRGNERQGETREEEEIENSGEKEVRGEKLDC